MKKYVAILIILVLFIAVYFNRFALDKYFSKNFPKLAQSTIVQTIKEDISAPPPLISDIFSPKAYLTLKGTIEQTNVNRSQNGNLPALLENQKLNAAAKLKLDDMFGQQYFEHINPQGVGPGDLAKKAGYNFISEGENLALGNFEDDAVLVTAWMNSPGHRANILNGHYAEIGVAVGQGMYEGKKTWLAVQEFGKPASDCPTVDSNLKSQINSSQTETNQLEYQLKTTKAQLDAENPQTQEGYNKYNQDLAQYNDLVHIYNNKVDVLKQLISRYNNEVNAYNSCLGNS
jgi:hypothetical protein